MDLNVVLGVDNFIFENFEFLDVSNSSILKSFIEETPKLELKILPNHLKYVFFGDDLTLHVIISTKLKQKQKDKLIDILSQHKKAFNWTIANIRGISHSICMHKILMEKNHQPKADP